MLFLPTLITLFVASVVKAKDDPPFLAPTKCAAQNTKSASSWQSCVTPATAFTACDIDNQPCACSAYTIQQKCYSKYCPGDYPHTSELEELCLTTPAAAPTDPFSNTFFHPTSETTAATAAPTSSTKNSSPTASKTQSTSTTATAKPNAATRMVGAMSVGGLFAAAIAVAVLL